MKSGATENAGGKGVAARRSLRILCADDDVPLATMLRLGLAHYGHDVELVKDGKEAVERIATADGKGFDLVVTDHEMPRMGGLALVQHLRASGYPGKIIVHSSEVRSSDAVAYRALRVDLMLQKPVTLQAFVTAMDKLGGVVP